MGEMFLGISPIGFLVPPGRLQHCPTFNSLLLTAQLLLAAGLLRIHPFPKYRYNLRIHGAIIGLGILRQPIFDVLRKSEMQC